MKKRTRLLTSNRRIVQRFEPFQCSYEDEHQTSEGSVGGAQLSTYAAHYPVKFCEQLAEAAAELAEHA